MNKIRVLVADDHAIVRTGLVSLLSRPADIEVVGEASDGVAAVAKASRLLPDVVVMDLVMPKKDGVAATAELHERHPEMKILILESITRGLTNAQIALQFDISPESVKTYIARLFEKLGASNRSEATSIAIRRHLLKI